MNARIGKGISQKKMVNAQFRGDSFQKGLQNRRFSLICQSGRVSFFDGLPENHLGGPLLPFEANTP